MHRVIYGAARKVKKKYKSEREGERVWGRGSAWWSVGRVINLYNPEIIVGPAQRSIPLKHSTFALYLRVHRTLLSPGKRSLWI